MKPERPLLVEAYPRPDGGAYLYAPARPWKPNPANCYRIEPGDWRYLERLLAQATGTCLDTSTGREVRQTVYICGAAAWDLLRPYGDGAAA